MKYHIEFDLEFRKNPYKGLYIAVEGIDGSGKTTQVKKLAEYFSKKGKTVVVTSEPRKGDSAIGKIIHEILQSKIKVPQEALQYLYSADRVINHKTIVEPALKKGNVVISHRCFWSVIPYGLFDKGLFDYNRIDTQVLFAAQGLLSMYHQFIAPDKTFYLDISADVAMKRLLGMKKIKELYEKREKLEKIIVGYRWLAKQFPKEIIVINGEQSEEAVFARIIKKL
ncbi:MAG: dTMP kinase [bacterium]|nr:dTMP kinase [bacterium]